MTRREVGAPGGIGATSGGQFEGGLPKLNRVPPDLPDRFQRAAPDETVGHGPDALSGFRLMGDDHSLHVVLQETETGEQVFYPCAHAKPPGFKHNPPDRFPVVESGPRQLPDDFLGGIEAHRHNTALRGSDGQAFHQVAVNLGGPQLRAGRDRLHLLAAFGWKVGIIKQVRRFGPGARFHTVKNRLLGFMGEVIPGKPGDFTIRLHVLQDHTLRHPATGTALRLFLPCHRNEAIRHGVLTRLAKVATVLRHEGFIGAHRAYLSSGSSLPGMAPRAPWASSRSRRAIPWSVCTKPGSGPAGGMD